MGRAPTAASGAPSRASGSSAGRSSPTGRRTGSGRFKRATSGRRLFAFDRSLGRRYVAGADEAGRGCLAGPLVAAAVLFDLEELTLGDRRALARLNDSKQHTEEARERLHPLVLRAASRTAVVVRCVRGIDARGLHRTNLEALRSALACVARREALCLVDGFRLPGFDYDQRALVDGDTRSAAIAAASILAKVTRDRYMRGADERHPGFDFATNVGYSTPEHRAAIERHGISPLHRVSFQSIAYQQLGFGTPASPEAAL